MSDVAYQSFINVGVNFPSLRFNKNLRAVLNKEFVFHSNNLGEYCVPTEKISYYFRIHKDKIKLQNNTMHIRLAGDGVNICKNFQVLNFTFAFLDVIIENENILDANSAQGNYILGKFHIKSECYNELKEALKELSEKLFALKELNIDGVMYKIEWWLGGDLKFLLLVFGLNAANSNYCCPWCTLLKEAFSENLCQHRINRKLSASEPGQIHDPIFSFIKIENVIADPLHLFLRVADKLINNMKQNLEELDRTFSVDLEAHTNLNTYVSFLEELKIKKGYYLDGTQFKLRSLDGVEKKKLFQNIDLVALFPGLPDGEKKSQIWKEFIILLYEMKDDRLEITEIKKKTSTWLKKVLTVNSFDAKKDVTPYLHIFGSHLHEQIENLKKIKLEFFLHKRIGIFKLLRYPMFSQKYKQKAYSNQAVNKKTKQS